MHGCLLEMKVICFLEIKAMIHMYELIIHLWKRSAEKILLAEMFACYQKLVITVCFTVISLLMEIKNWQREGLHIWYISGHAIPSQLSAHGNITELRKMQWLVF